MQPLEPTDGSADIEQSQNKQGTASQEPFLTFLSVKARFHDSNILYSDIEDSEFISLARSFNDLYRRFWHSEKLDDELKTTIRTLKNKSAAIVTYKKKDMIEKAYDILDEIIDLIIGELND